MNAPSLRLLRYEVTEVALRAVETFDIEKKSDGTLNFTLGTARSAMTQQAFKVALEMSFPAAENRNVPYDVRFTVTGHFISNVWLSPSGLPAFIVTNALTILYGVARGLIGQISATSTNGLFVLPTVLFSSSVSEAAAESNSSIISDDAYRALTRKHIESPKGALGRTHQEKRPKAKRKVSRKKT